MKLKPFFFFACGSRLTSIVSEDAGASGVTFAVLEATGAGQGVRRRGSERAGEEKIISLR